jgi:hypothetical protein
MNAAIKLREWEPGVAMANHSIGVTPELIEVVLRMARLELQPKAEHVGAITLCIDVDIRATITLEVCKDFVLPKKDEVLVKEKGGGNGAG